MEIKLKNESTHRRVFCCCVLVSISWKKFAAKNGEERTRRWINLRDESVEWGLLRKKFCFWKFSVFFREFLFRFEGSWDWFFNGRITFKKKVQKFSTFWKYNNSFFFKNIIFEYCCCKKKIVSKHISYNLCNFQPTYSIWFSLKKHISMFLFDQFKVL